MNHGLLLIGYGNELRRDDGLGPRIAAAIQRRKYPGVTVLVRHQLTPELAEPISSAQEVVFVDAAVDGDPEVQLRPIKESAASAAGHASSPSLLLGLARSVFGKAPAAWWLTVPTFDLSTGEGLSEPARVLARRAEETLLTFMAAWAETRSGSAKLNSASPSSPAKNCC